MLSISKKIYGVCSLWHFRCSFLAVPDEGVLRHLLTLFLSIYIYKENEQMQVPPQVPHQVLVFLIFLIFR